MRWFLILINNRLIHNALLASVCEQCDHGHSVELISAQLVKMADESALYKC